MNMYLLYYNESDDSHPVGIFSSKFQAKEHLKTCYNHANEGYEWRIKRNFEIIKYIVDKPNEN